MSFNVEGIDVRVSPWPGEIQSCLVTSRSGGILSALSFSPLAEIKKVAASLGYESLLWQATDEFTETTCQSLGFDFRDRLHVLISSDLKPTVRYRQSNTLTVRRARSMDIDSVLEIDHMCFEPFWQLDQQGLEEAVLATPRSRYRVIVDKSDFGSVLGYSIFGQGAGSGYLQRIAMSPSHQRSGGATSLIADGFGWLRRWRSQKVSVNTQVTNERALALYLGLGFKLQRQGLSLYQCPSS